MWIYLLTVITLFILYFAYKQYSKNKKYPYMDGPKSLPLLGILSAMKDTTKALTVKTLENCKKWPRMYYVSNIIISGYYVVDPVLMKEVLISRSNDFMNHATVLRESDAILTSKGSINLKDKEWKERRNMLSPHFSATKITAMIPVFIKHANNLVIKLSKSVGEELNICPLLNNFTLDVLGETVFGTQFESQIDPNSRITKVTNQWVDNLFSMTMFTLIPMWNHLPLKKVKDFKKGQDILANICKQVVENRKKNGIKENDLLQSLIDSDLPDDSLLSEAFLFLLAGYETTSITLSWIIYALSQNPDVEKKMTKEIDEILKGQPPNEENVYKLKFLENVIYETLRMYPAVLASTRENTEEIVLDGITFPPKTTFFIPIWATHHNEKYWNEPNKFIPERFENNSHTTTFLPFGLGPRMCLGYRFSLVETKIVIAMLYQHFTFKYDHPFPKIGIGHYKPLDLNVTVHSR